MGEIDLDRGLIAIGRKMQSLLRRQLPHDLTLTQSWMLNLLDEQQHLPMSEIAEHLNITLSAASNVVDQLMHSGWVTRQRSTEDRRVATVELTEAGRQMLDEAKRLRREILESVLGALSADDVAALQRILEKLEGVLAAPQFS